MRYLAMDAEEDGEEEDDNADDGKENTPEIKLEPTTKTTADKKVHGRTKKPAAVKVPKKRSVEDSEGEDQENKTSTVVVKKRGRKKKERDGEPVKLEIKTEEGISDVTPKVKIAAADEQEDVKTEDTVIKSEPKKRGRKKKDEVKSEANFEDVKISEKDEKEIERLKSYVTKCGVRKLWGVEFKGKNGKERIQHVKAILSDLGITGRPTLELCKKIKQEREWAAETADLDTSNIIEGRSTRRNDRSKKTAPAIDPELELKRTSEMEALLKLGSPEAE
ncbi:HIRA-interacting protein 3 [Phlyctochytrium planicorne]|nr:HIRA-interacting protein 3 [Phlyctochytrium planicorne]